MTAEAVKKASTKKTRAVESKPAKAAQAAKPRQPAAPSGGAANNSLRLWNFRLAFLLVAGAAAVVVAGSSRTLELTTQYLAKDVLASEAAGREVLASATRHLADVPLAWAVAAALAALAAVYVLAATVWRRQYELWLERGTNRLRWVGLGAGGGAMLVIVAMLSGISDVSVLALFFGSVLLAALLASAVEAVGAGRRLRVFLAGGAIVGVFLPWLVLVNTGLGAVAYGGSLPAYLYYVYASATLLLVAVGLALYFRVRRRGKWADGIYTEKMFMGLGFIALTILAMQIFAGALQS